MTNDKLAHPAAAIAAAPGAMSGRRFEAGEGLLGFVRRWRERQEAQEMLRLDERMLQDIGLTRGDIEYALESSAGGSVSETLNKLRVERQQATRSLLAGRRPASIP